MKLKDIVEDWGGFEELVKDLHTDGTVDVQRNVVLVGRSGASRQIDVLMTHKTGPYSYVTIIECKFWKKKVERQHVDVLHSSMQDLNASKGAFFTTVGYQEGAEIYAKSIGIDIFVIRELTGDEWGKPGEIIDFYIHIISTTNYDFNFINSAVISRNPKKPENRVELSLNFVNEQNAHQILSKHKEKHGTLEAYVEAATQHALKTLQERPFLLNGGEECTRYFAVPVEMPFKEKGEDLLVANGEQVILIPKLTFVVGVKINQSRFIFDRSQKYDYALVIEDCASDRHYVATKEDQQIAKWSPVKTGDLNDQPDALVNGSILNVVLKGHFDPKKMEGLEEVRLEDVQARSKQNPSLEEGV